MLWATVQYHNVLNSAGVLVTKLTKIKITHTGNVHWCVCVCARACPRCVSGSRHLFTQPATQPLTLALYGFLIFPKTPVKESLCTKYLNPLNACVWLDMSDRSRSCSSGRPGAEKPLGKALPPARSRHPTCLSRSGDRVTEHTKTQRLDQWDGRVNHWPGAWGSALHSAWGPRRGVSLLV